MHDHLQHCDGGYPDVFEVVRVVRPGPRIVEGFVCFFIVLVEGVAVGVDEGDGIVEFCLVSG